MTPDRETFLALLTQLLMTNSPPGHEDEINAVLVDEIASLGLSVEVDGADDLL